MARMKIVLKQDVDSLGSVGEVVQVAGGYARNFLIPRGLALPATKGNLKQAESWRSGADAKAGKELTEARDIQAKLESATLTIGAQAGPDGKLFGSITSAQIADAAKAAFDVDVDRHTIVLDEPIRSLGTHEVHAKLHRDVTAKITVEAVES